MSENKARKTCEEHPRDLHDVSNLGHIDNRPKLLAVVAG